MSGAERHRGLSAVAAMTAQSRIAISASGMPVPKRCRLPSGVVTVRLPVSIASQLARKACLSRPSIRRRRGSRGRAAGWATPELRTRLVPENFYKAVRFILRHAELGSAHLPF